MPTIKTKKEMNLPQLIEWGWENIEQVRGKDFKSSVRDSFGNYSIVQFSVDGYGFKTDSVSHKDTFAVEIEEPITEDTEIPKLYMRHNNDHIDECYGMSISKFDKSRVKAFYVPNDDLTMTLIWTKEKGLV